MTAAEQTRADNLKRALAERRAALRTIERDIAAIEAELATLAPTAPRDVSGKGQEA